MGKTDNPPPRIKELLRYDPETGYFHWLVRTHGGRRVILPGDVAGTAKDGYVNIHLEKTVYRAHRLAWFVMTEEWLLASQDVDHLNGIRNDNRWDNLRLATRSQNNMNLPVKSNNRTGTRGVSWSKQAKKWDSRITINRKVICLGTYDRIEDAVSARKAAEEEHFGEFSFLKRAS